MTGFLDRALSRVVQVDAPSIKSVRSVVCFVPLHTATAAIACNQVTVHTMLDENLVVRSTIRCDSGEVVQIQPRAVRLLRYS